MPVTSALLITALILAAYLWWGFTTLPAERWQILVSVPHRKNEAGGWHGINFTWYGLLTANAYLAAVAILLVLLGSVGVTPPAIALLTIAMLLCCVPASRLVARLVEKKTDTFTVGGAVFVGIIITPLVIMLFNRFAGQQPGFRFPIMATWAALTIAYTFGEGLGRLACISFGCCYGKPLVEKTPILVRLLSIGGFIFHGNTKKIVYADGLEAVPVIPVQAMTAVLYTTCGLVASALFFASHHTAAFLLGLVTTQAWRTYSETLRADYRGNGKVSPYQIMGLAGMLYAVGMANLLYRDKAVVPALLKAGLSGLWQPGIILFLQAIWLVIFLYTGRSTVTGSTLQFHVCQDRI